jgi:hypothetical protein
MIVGKQLDIFEQLNKQAYKEYYNRFYAKQLREAKESREKKIQPIEIIMISTGEVRPLTTYDLKPRKHE